MWHEANQKEERKKKIVKMRDSVTQKMNLNFLFANIDFAEDKQTHIYKRSHKNTHTHSAFTSTRIISQAHTSSHSH